MPDNTGKFGDFGFSGVMRAARQRLFRLYRLRRRLHRRAGSEQSERDMPIGIIGSLAICTVFTSAFACVLTGMLTYKTMNDTAISEALALHQHRLAAERVVIGTLAGYTSVILVMLLGQSRVFYSMSRDGLLPRSSPSCIRNSAPRGAPTSCSWSSSASSPASCRSRASAI